MRGEHTLERCREVTRDVLSAVFNQLKCQRVMLEGMLLRPNMVVPGLRCSTQATAEEIADSTVNCLLETVPTAIPGIAFLSGVQPSALASAALHEINARYKSQVPWALAFSFGPAILQPGLAVWSGDKSNIKQAQRALLHQARCNRGARRGDYASVFAQKSL
jgi:fructose-bisphosphate aldolase class I